MLYSFTYVSTACVPMSGEELQVLAAVCSKNNRQDAISGLLLYKDGHFMQTLEGVRRRVENMRQRIVLDPRNRNLTAIAGQYIPAREFPTWAMGFIDLSHGREDMVVSANALARCSLIDPLLISSPANARAFMLSVRDRLLTPVERLPAAPNSSEPAR